MVKSFRNKNHRNDNYGTYHIGLFGVKTNGLIQLLSSNLFTNPKGLTQDRFL